MLMQATDRSKETTQQMNQLIGEGAGIARKQRRDFAIIPFSGFVRQVEIFPKGRYNIQKLVDVCHRFMDGGTNFEEPLNEELQIIEKDRFKQADILFVTDGDSHVSEEFLK